MGNLNVRKIVQIFNILIFFLFQSLYFEMIHLLFIAAMTGPASRRLLFLHVRIQNTLLSELGRIAHSAATREHQFFSVLEKNNITAMPGRRNNQAVFSAGHWQWIAFSSWSYFQLASLILYGNKTSQLHQQHWHWIHYNKCTISQFYILSTFNPFSLLGKQAHRLSVSFKKISHYIKKYKDKILKISVLISLPSKQTLCQKMFFKFSQEINQLSIQ